MSSWRMEGVQLVLSRNKVAVGEPVAEKRKNDLNACNEKREGWREMEQGRTGGRRRTKNERKTFRRGKEW